MLTKNEIKHVVEKYRRLRSTIGSATIKAMGRAENERLRDVWLEEYRSFQNQ